jgi:uncharacterized oxidoreductase
MELGDNTILVTGGGSGIGLALAKAFALRGNTVIVCGRNAQKLEAVHRENPRCTASCHRLQSELSGMVKTLQPWSS